MYDRYFSPKICTQIRMLTLTKMKQNSKHTHMRRSTFNTAVHWNKVVDRIWPSSNYIEGIKSESKELKSIPLLYFWTTTFLSHFSAFLIHYINVFIIQCSIL